MNEKLKILIVDDFEMVRQLVKQSLIQIGLTQNSEAINGLDAYNKIKEAHSKNEQFDLVFIDWNMPEMNGLEVVQKCKADPDLNKTIFIMVSAEQDQKNIVTALKNGVSDYVTKPFLPEVLRTKIYRILQKKNVA